MQYLPELESVAVVTRRGNLLVVCAVAPSASAELNSRLQVRVTALESAAGGGDAKQPVVESVGFVRGGLTSASWSPGKCNFLA